MYSRYLYPIVQLGTVQYRYRGSRTLWVVTVPYRYFLHSCVSFSYCYRINFFFRLVYMYLFGYLGYLHFYHSVPDSKSKVARKSDPNAKKILSGRKSFEAKNTLNHFLRRISTLYFLVSNAAVNPYFGPILDCPETTWDKIFEVNVKTAFLLFKGRLFSLIGYSGGVPSGTVPYRSVEF